MTTSMMDPRLDPDKPTLVCMMGLPRSGKSTWIKDLMGLYPVVSTDALRLEMYGQRKWMPGEKLIWATADLMVRTLFRAGHTSVILDATNLTRWERDQWKSEKWDTVFHEISTPLWTCIDRANRDGMPDLEEVILQLAAGSEPLGHDELRW